MPISITPATTVHPRPVVLSNSLGYAVTARLSVTTCGGKVLRSGRTITLASGQAVKSPPTRNHVLVTWSVQRAQQQPGAIQTVASMTSRQGCPAVKVSHPALPKASKTVAGVQVAAPKPAGFPAAPVAAMVLGAFLLVACAIWLQRRRTRRTGGAHR